MFFEQAKPIWAKGLLSERNLLLSFRTTVPQTKNGEPLMLKVTADCFYHLFVNGQFFAHGPAACGEGHWRVDEINLSDACRKGENTLEFFVLHYGVDTFEYIRQEPFFEAEILSKGTVIRASGHGDFLCRRVLSRPRVSERYSFQRGFLESWHLPLSYSEPLDVAVLPERRLLPRLSPCPDYPRVRDLSLVSRGRFHIDENVEDDLKNRLERVDTPTFSFNTDEIPRLYRLALKGIKGDAVASLAGSAGNFSLDENEFLILSLPVEKTGFLSCRLSCDVPSEIFFLYSEILSDGDVRPLMGGGNFVCSLLPLSLEPGRHDFTAIEPVSMKYVKVLVPRGRVTVEELSLICYERTEKDTISFHCDDPKLDAVFAAAKNTFLQNAVEIFTDCPSRERAGWLCDSFFTGRAEKDITGENRTEHDFLQNFLLSSPTEAVPPGMLPMCYPGNPTTYIPNWAMFFVLELLEYTKRTGDDSLAKEAKERVYALLDYFAPFENSEGLLEKLSGWIFVEWSDARLFLQDVNFPTNMLYYKMLLAVAELYDDVSLVPKARALKSAIRARSKGSLFFRDHALRLEDGTLTVPDDISEVCQYYAFFTGVATVGEDPELLETLLWDFGPGRKGTTIHPGVRPANAFIGNFLRLEILSAEGHSDKVMEEIVPYFYYMAQRTGTLWENDGPTASCNHGFSSHVIHAILRDGFGIRDLDTVHKKCRIDKACTLCGNAQVGIPVPGGRILVTVKDGQKTVSLPEGYVLSAL